ncbi:hypothetical protein OTU49_000574 [Cherax quadricarinatus]|uniref:Tr-type G domain-containing protein n=1 Tax=Cherax quadricarinatus TaxID=27406 RepID=A0AAW0XJG8_CHEQU
MRWRLEEPLQLEMTFLDLIVKVGANAGVVGMTKEHLGLALALNVPVFVIVTKIDMCPPNVLQDTLKLLHKILKSAGCRKVPLLVRNAEDVVVSATNFVSERLCPIFQVSNVSGDNLDLLTMFLNLLSSRTPQNDSDPAQFQIDDTYQVPGEILVLHHPTTISTKYQAMVHVGSVRQTASIIAMDKECLRTGDKAIVHFRFIKHPEYLKNGLKMVFREGRTKAVGRVLEVIPKIASLQHQKNHKIMKMVKQAGGSDGSTTQHQGLAGGNLGGTKKQRSRRGGKHRSRGSNSAVSGNSGLHSPSKQGGTNSPVSTTVSNPISATPVASGIVHTTASGTSTSTVHPRPDNLTSPPLVTTQVSV